MKKICFGKVLSFTILCLFVFVLGSCSTNCIHCNEANKSNEYYKSVLVVENIGVDYSENKKLQIITNYNDLEKYFIEHPEYENNDYFCEKTFDDCYLLVIEWQQNVTIEYKFKDFKIIENNILLTKFSDYDAATAFQSSHYYVLIPQNEFPSDFQSDLLYNLNLI